MNWYERYSQFAQPVAELELARSFFEIGSDGKEGLTATLGNIRPVIRQEV